MSLPVALLLALTLRAAPEVAEGQVRVQPGETLAMVARRALGDAAAASELRALNGLLHDRVPVGTTLKLPGPERGLALSTLDAARTAISQAPTGAVKRPEATARLKEADALFARAEYRSAAQAADAAWRLVSARADDPTQFAVEVSEDGRTRVNGRSGKAVHVEAQGVTQPVYAGEEVRVEKGQPPSPPRKAPALLLPADGERVSTQGKGWALSWLPVRGAESYVIEVSAEGRSDGAVALLKAVRSPARVESLAPGHYAWTVQAVYAGGERGLAAPTRRFELTDEQLKLEVRKSRWKTGGGKP